MPAFPVMMPVAAMAIGLDEEEKVAGMHFGVVRDAERHEGATHQSKDQLAPFAAYLAQQAWGLVGLDPVLDQTVLLAANQVHEQLAGVRSLQPLGDGVPGEVVWGEDLENAEVLQRRDETARAHEGSDRDVGGLLAHEDSAHENVPVVLPGDEDPRCALWMSAGESVLGGGVALDQMDVMRHGRRVDVRDQDDGVARGLQLLQHDRDRWMRAEDQDVRAFGKSRSDVQESSHSSHDCRTRHDGESACEQRDRGQHHD